MTKSLEEKSTLVNRNITVLGRRTSIRLEPVMWDALHEMAEREQCTIHDLSSLIYLRKKTNTSLTAAIRIFIVLYFWKAATEEGHQKAGHGNFSYMLTRARIKNSDPPKTPRNLRYLFSTENQPVLSKNA